MALFNQKDLERIRETVRASESMRGLRGPEAERPNFGEGFPFWTVHDFALSFSGADVTIGNGLRYRGALPVAIAGATITITADNQWAVMEYPGINTGVGLVRLWTDTSATPTDEGGKLVRGLYKFALDSDGNAYLLRETLAAAQINMLAL